MQYKCYDTIVFGWVTHTLDAAAKRVPSFVLRHSHSVTWQSVDRVLATINLYYKDGPLTELRIEWAEDDSIKKGCTMQGLIESSFLSSQAANAFTILVLYM